MACGAHVHQKSRLDTAAHNCCRVHTARAAPSNTSLKHVSHGRNIAIASTIHRKAPQKGKGLLKTCIFPDFWAQARASRAQLYKPPQGLQ